MTGFGLLLYAVMNWMSFHPVHVSVTNLEYSPAEGMFMLSVKVFSDDFQEMINYYYGTGINLLDKKDPGQSIDAINAYVRENLLITCNSRDPLYLEFDRIQLEGESTWLYYLAAYDKRLRKMSVENKILLNWFDDQTNLLIFVQPGSQRGYRFNHKTSKLDIPI